ncbi:developmentally-regulated GTP-binding protein 2 [Plakobranchus ocellatus]|uniref:Developmentally-regulated GTP-binding protein 2 n=1 Tax=Plakobranchus ocellatus TaxID=259542 RepID=A0AAV4AYY7_9GAST|nr:developmentally-regulated GTP-binding protein 2 [Plakobranchus ocellatus]
MTEKSQIIKVNHHSVTCTARWSDLCNLFDHEECSLLKLSAHTKQSVRPSNIEKQKVSLALNVFSEKTSAALKTSSINNESSHQTAVFIDEVLKLRKIFNCKTPGSCHRLRDPDRAPIDLTETGTRQIETLSVWADIATSLEPTFSPCMFCFTKNTARAITWTCKCLVELAKYFLTTSTVFRHQYVALGFFQQDDIEKHFAHSRMSAGINYYITAEDVANTHAIDTAKLLSECGEIDVSALESLHQCYLCEKCLTDEEILTLDELPNKICELSGDERMSLFHIGGYVASKEKDECLIGQSHDFPLDVQAFTESLSPGGLTSSSHKFYQLIVYFYLFFSNPTEPSCRRWFMNIFNDFPSIYHIDMVLKLQPCDE